MRVMAIANHKGGSGKTTVAVNLAHALAEGGERVLLVDLDPQGNAGVALGLDVHRAERSVHGLFTDRRPRLGDYVMPVGERLAAVVSNLDSASLETELVTRMNRERILAGALEGADWDTVLIDCPPSLGLLTTNALVAAGTVLVVVDPGFFALYGLKRLEDTVEQVRETFGGRLQLWAMVNNLDARQNLDRDVADEVRRVFGARMLETVVRRNVKLKEAQSAGQPILAYAPTSKGAADFRALADEVRALHRPARKRAAAGRRDG